MRHSRTTLTFFLFPLLCVPLRLPAQDIDVMQGMVVVKFRSEAAYASKNDFPLSLREMCERYRVTAVRPLLRQPQHFHRDMSRVDEDVIRWDEELGRIKVLEYRSGETPWTVARAFSALPDVEYAEPYFLFVPVGGAMTPDDSLFAQQEYMKLIRAEDAWDICRGDTSVVVAVADTEIKWDHPDLEPNIWINPGETGLDTQGRDKRSNGVDDDGNGMKDDWHGWDYAGKDNATPDNDTRDSTGGHGTSVAGLVGTATNNRIGLASIGYSCRILPIKIGPDGGGNLAYGYDAIDYASRMGARVFNASWGSFAYSKALEDVVSAAVARGMVIVGGAGNHGGTAPFYPASYPAVLDAGVCNVENVISGASGYGPTLDVVSPAEGAYSTNVRNGYSRWGAVTSAAAPMASGLCALVASHFPAFTAEQVRERVRVTCDDIDAKNPTKAKLAGRGRLNAYRALADPPTPSVRIASSSILDPNNDKRLDVGETVGISVTLDNFLSATDGEVRLALTPVRNASNVQVTRGNVVAPALPAGARHVPAAEPFEFRVLPSSNYDAVVLFRVDITAGAYADFDFVSVPVNPSYVEMTSGKLSLTIQANGMFGYRDYPDNTQGNGLRYDGIDGQLYLGSVLMGTNEAHVVGNARSASSFLVRDNDLLMSDAATVQRPAGAAAARAISHFSDAGADSARRLGVFVTHEVFDFSNRGVEDVLFSKFTVENRSAQPLEGFRFGLFMDFGGYPQYYIANAVYDSTRRFAALTKSGFPIVGTFVIDTLPLSHPGRSTFWAINNDHRVSGNPFGTLDGFTAREKWLALSSFAGNRSTPAGNLAYVITAPVADVPPGGTAEFVFGHIAGTSLASMRNRVDAAVNLWLNPPVVGCDPPSVPLEAALGSVHPHPLTAGACAIVSFTLPAERRVVLELYSPLGRRVGVLRQGTFPAGTHPVPFTIDGGEGVYILRLIADGVVVHRPVVVLH
ncbi:MAG: S8 family serine peptidase [Bacteroidota bacterium]|nr:S8 family serine peptidase [Bacteroidota bacterium]